MRKITELPKELKHLSIAKMLKHYEFLCLQPELSDKEQRAKANLRDCIEISLRDNGEWAALIMFTDDKDLIALCQEKINVKEIVDEIINQPITKRLINNFTKNSYNLN